MAPRPAPSEPPALAKVAARIHWPKTLMNKGSGQLRREHLVCVQPPVEPAALHLIALDHSGSMRSGARLAEAKAFAAGLVESASRSGAQVAVLLFGGLGVQWLQGAAPARRSAIPRLGRLGGGGGTPIGEGLRVAQVELQAFRRRSGAAPRTLWLLTDGRSLEQPDPPSAAERIVIVNFDDPQRPRGRCQSWAQRWGAELRQPPVH